MTIRVALFGCVLALGGCLGTESGNPPAAPTTMGLRTSDPAVAAIGPAAGVDAVTEAWASVIEARFVLGSSCDHVSDPVLTAVVGDAVVGVDTPGVPAGDVCGLHLVLGPPSALPPGAPPELDGRSVFVRGTRADGSPFEIATEHAPSVDVVTAGPTIALREGTAILLTFDAARWLGLVSLATVAPDADGVARIEPGDPQLAAFDSGLEGSLEIFGDTDADGVLDPVEEAAGALAASH